MTIAAFRGKLTSGNLATFCEVSVRTETILTPPWLLVPYGRLLSPNTSPTYPNPRSPIRYSSTRHSKLCMFSLNYGHSFSVKHPFVI